MKRAIELINSKRNPDGSITLSKELTDKLIQLLEYAQRFFNEDKYTEIKAEDGVEAY